MSKKEVDLAMIVNNQTMNDYFNRLYILAVSLFSWENLNYHFGYGAETFLEKALFNFGRACAVLDKEIGLKVFNVNPCDKLNNYDLPIEIEATAVGYCKKFKFDDIVYIKNNLLEIPTVNTLQLISYRLFETERTIDVNLVAQKTPVLIEGDTKSILTLKNVYMQYSGNTPFIFGNKQFDVSNKLNVLKTDAPYLIDKLELHKHELWNEALTYLGIDNANTDKKERLITDEVESNNELISYYLNCFYKTRKEACDMINEKFLKNKDKKIKIIINNDILNKLGFTEDDITGGDVDGSLHNND